MNRRWLLLGIGSFVGSLFTWAQTKIKIDQIELLTNAQLRQADITPNADGTYTKRANSIIYRNGQLQRPEADFQTVGLNTIKYDPALNIGVITEVWYG